MKYFTLVLAAAILTACGGDSESDNEGTPSLSGNGNAGNDTTPIPTSASASTPESVQGTPTVSGGDKSEDAEVSSEVIGSIAAMTKMVAKNSTVSEESIVGTWVAAWDIRSERSEIIAAPRIEQYPDLLVKRTEFIVIRPSTETDKFEIASCNGNGMEVISLNDNALSTDSRKLKLTSNKSMMMSYVIDGQKVVVPRLNTNFDYEPSFVEKKTVNAKYIKISDSYGSLGEFTQNWRPTSLQPTDASHAEIEKSIYCIQLDDVTNAGLYTLRIGSDDKMKLHVTGSDYSPTEPMAFAFEPSYQGPLSGLIDTGAEACKANVDIFHRGEDGRIKARFLIQQNGGNQNAIGSELIDINLQ